MPTIELLAEIELLKENLAYAGREHHMNCRKIESLEARADRAEAELAALGRDARLLANIIDAEICECGCDMDGNTGNEEVCLICQISAIVSRILEATKGEP